MPDALEPDLETKVDGLRRGWIRATYRQAPSGRGPINSPWLNVGFALVFVGISIPPLAGWTRMPPEVAIPVFGVLDALAVLLLVVSVLRIPVWHRARRIAREHIELNGGDFPLALRWYQ